MTSKKKVELKRPRPYYDTKVPPEQTKFEIEQLLKAYGIKDTQWTTYHGTSELKFLVQIDNREISFVFRPPVIMIPRKTWNAKAGKYETVPMPHDAMSYRLLWHYLKAKLEAISWGIETIEKEFLSHVMIALPSGQETTIGDQIKQVMESTQKALENKPSAPVNITGT